MLIPLTDEDQPVDMPVATFALIALNLIVFVYSCYASSYEDVVHSWGYVPSRERALTSLTGLFLHAGFFHFLGNMLYLWVVGPNLESAMGKTAFVLFYLACGSFGDFAHSRMIATSMRSVPCIGASGAIAGLMGAFFLLFPRNRIRLLFWLFAIRFTFALPAVVPIGLWFLQQFMAGSQHGQVTSVSYGAHLGGFILGAVAAGLMVLLGLVRPRWEARVRAQSYW